MTDSEKLKAISALVAYKHERRAACPKPRMHMTNYEKTKAVSEIIAYIKDNKYVLNDFNKLVDHATTTKPDWLEALCDPGVILLVRTYCHD